MTEGKRFAHYFDRYFDFEGQRVDRLDSIKTHGLLSPLEAQRRGVPYKQSSGRATNMGVSESITENVIYLYDLRERKGLPTPGDTMVYVNEGVELLSLDDMRRKFGDWAELSMGEVYAIGNIDHTKLTYE